MKLILIQGPGLGGDDQGRIMIQLHVIGKQIP
jgi:hypothetical protein